MALKWNNEDVWVADFEDGPINDIPFDKKHLDNGFEVRVWLWCAVNPFTGARFMGNDVVSFLNWCANGRKLVYFHNLKHDGSFILDYVLRFKTLKTNHGVLSFRPKEDRKLEKPGDCFFFIDGAGHHFYYRFLFRKKRVVEIRDSLKIVPCSVHDLGVSIGLYKGRLEDYHAVRPVGYQPTKEDIEYCYRDCDIVAAFVKKFWTNEILPLKKLTAGSDSVSMLKYLCFYKPYGFKRGEAEFNYDFPPLDSKAFDFVAEAYSGGLSFVNPVYKGKTVENVISLDINSMYPYIMNSRVLPYGKPMAFVGEPFASNAWPLWVATVTFDYKAKAGRFAVMHSARFHAFGRQSFAENGKGETRTLTSVEWELINRQYDVSNVSWHGGLMFRAKQGLLSPFIEYLYDQKAVLKSSDPMRFIVKRMLNSSYGKFGQKPKPEKRIPYLDEIGVVRYKDEVEKDAKPSKAYIPFAAFVTAYARLYIMENIEKVHGRFCYCDTDSMKVMVDPSKPLEAQFNGIPLDSHKLGYFKNETGPKPLPYARFLRAKTYAGFDGNKKTIAVTVAGLRDTAGVTFDNFKEGAQYKAGKLQPFQCKGGVVLEPVDFTISAC